MNKFLTFEVEDNNWSNIVNQCIDFDFYHTQAYHLLDKQNRPILLVGQYDEIIIAFPIILRNIPATNLHDCTSAYGYCGPISNQSTKLIPEKIIDNFILDLKTFFNKNKIITAFSRLHPLIENDRILKNLGEITHINNTIAINLKLSLEDQRSQFRKSTKSEINQLKRKGYSVVEATSNEDIERFIEIYYQTMTRVNANQYYFFSKNYFYEFLNNPNFKNSLLLAKKDNIICAGAIFTITHKIMQYHLAGTDELFMKDTPMKLILDEARLLGNQLKLDFLHLGGGAGGSDEDSLFKFKSGFSDYQFSFKVWKLILDNEIYESLIKPEQKLKTSNFFPLYRS